MLKLFFYRLLKYVIKMGKKINSDAVTIKSLLKQGMKPIKIARLLEVSKQKVNYWRKTEIKYIQKKNFHKNILKKYIN